MLTTCGLAGADAPLDYLEPRDARSVTQSTLVDTLDPVGPAGHLVIERRQASGLDPRLERGTT